MGITKKIIPSIVIYNSMLAILLRLITDDTPLKFTPNDYDGNFSDVVVLAHEIMVLYDGVKCQCDEKHKFVELSFDKHYEDRLLGNLRQYFNRIREDRVGSDSIPVKCWKTLNSDFLASTEGKILDNFVLNSTEYMHIILEGVLTEKMSVHNIKLWFYRDCDKVGSSRIFKGDYDYSESWNDDFIKCVIKLDITKYVKERKALETQKQAELNEKTRPHKPLNSYTKGQRLLLDLIFTKKDLNDNKLTINDIIDYGVLKEAKVEDISVYRRTNEMNYKTSMNKRASTFISKFNTAFMKNNNTNKHLLVKNEYLESYVIDFSLLL